MAAGPDGGLYVAIPRQRDEVVMLLGRDGRPRSGWPIVLTAPGDCYTLLAVADGSVRIVCHRAALDDGLGGGIGRAFAFDAQGRAMPGWPVDVEDFFDASMVGSDLVALARPYAGDTLEQGSPELVRMVVVAADGAVRTGADVSFACCDNDFAIGPGAIGVVSTRDWHDEGTSVTTRLVAFDEGGPRDGWPVTLDGNASEVAFDPRGAIQLVVSPPYRPPSRTVVLGPDGRSLPGGSGDLAIVPTGTWNGAGDPWPGAPIVAFDGTAFIASTEEGGPTTILALDPGGRPIAGWPYRSKRGVQYINTCGEADTGCGSLRTLLSAGPGNRLYLFAEAASSSTGGSMVAIGPDGRVIDGWPVTLRRAGSMFWSMAVSPDGGVWALAIEPEERDFSATILAVDDDSTVRSATTVVEP